MIKRNGRIYITHAEFEKRYNWQGAGPFLVHPNINFIDEDEKLVDASFGGILVAGMTIDEHQEYLMEFEERIKNAPKPEDNNEIP